MYAVFEVFLGEVVDGVERFLGFGLVIAKQNFLNVRQTVAEEHVLGAEEADAAGTLVECRKRLGGFSIGADVEGLDFLAPVENRLSGFFELGRNGHGDFAEINFASRTGNRDKITTFYGVAAAAECTGGFVDRDFGGADDGGDAPCGGHDGGVGNLRTGGGQNTTAGLHALDIFLARHNGHEDSIFFVGLGGECFVLGEADFTTGSARRGSGTLGDHRGGLAVFRLDLGVYYVLPCYFAKRLNTHGFRRYALRAYAPMRPAMRSTAVRSVRIRWGENDYFSPRLS